MVPFGAGGGADSVARAVGTRDGERLGTDMPVINVPGATGSSGIANMLASTPGQAIAVLIQDTLATVPAGSASFSMDEIQAVCRMQSMPSALFVRKGDFADWEDLAATAKEEDLLVATVGTNSVDDIVLAALEDVQGTPFRAVPYSEPGERYTALLSGEVDALYEQLGDVTSFLDSGDFVPVVIFADEPVKGFEDVPLASDLDLPDEVVLPQFRGLVTSADATDSVVEQRRTRPARTRHPRSRRSRTTCSPTPTATRTRRSSRRSWRSRRSSSPSSSTPTASAEPMRRRCTIDLDAPLVPAHRRRRPHPRGRRPGRPRAAAWSAPAPRHRAPDLEYLAQVARAADRLGFDGMLTPCGTGCEDAWLATAALIRETSG